jgi:hypothetical protein
MSNLLSRPDAGTLVAENAGSVALAQQNSALSANESQEPPIYEGYTYDYSFCRLSSLSSHPYD